ncbi:FAD-binding oxidoreductase [Catellatospora sp. KI3]|uniref:FAD-dependent oxidoreductase n=1 Tax=Catellatospora sp. KI3 TaxID=3041620 RepID=UPI0024829C78|nr:FAD-binding oxidoreductase [Catellatospora sp. KI3]MDI1464652.1 FAD-binding oxidoreductase [Catellatospora sp. KI3]
MEGDPGRSTRHYGVHDRAVAALRARYDALPAGSPVRLAKRTSNLFRFGDRTTGPGLDVSAFDRVLEVDARRRTAQVQGMVTYERLVEATLRHGMMPLVVPQLKTITLGGAVAGLGIESTSYRSGLPHESVRELEVLTGDGQVVVARADNEHAGLLRAFPNSYGTLGYALRLEIELEPVRPYVRLRHRRFHDLAAAAAALDQLVATGRDGDHQVDFLDGVVFDRRDIVLTLASFVDDAPSTSDYTGQKIYYRSLRERAVDHLTVHDYLWRWDTDWFWCSRAFGAQHPLVRRLWPRRYRRSDVYHHLVALDRRHRLTERLDRRRGRPPQEAVVQDIEVPVGRLPEFMDFFHREIGISPIWLCPLRLRSDSPWPLYPLKPGETYVNVGFWSSVPLRPGQRPGHHNRLIEDEVAALGGHKSLYSTVHYSPEEFWAQYDGAAYTAAKRAYDPDGRLPDLYDKCVRT